MIDRLFFLRRRRSPHTAGSRSVQADTWRPAAELPAAAAWFAAAGAAFVFLLTDAVPDAPALSTAAASTAMGLLRLARALTVLSDRASLAGSRLQLVFARDYVQKILAGRAGKGRADKAVGGVWFGRGFEWGPEHAQKLYELSKIDVERLLPPRAVCRVLNRAEPKDPDAVGLAAIDGLESRKKDVWVSEKTLEGGTLIVGTTQAGKGVLLTGLVTQAIVRGEAVIVIDPKMSSRLQQAVRAAAQLAGRSEPLFFHPNRAEGLRINPLAHFERAGELASRITAVMNEAGPFAAFAWSAVDVVVNVMVHAGLAPTLAGIETALTQGLDELLACALEVDCGPAAAEAYFDAAKLNGLKERDAMLFVLDRAREDGRLAPETLKAAATYAHDPVHFSKITASLMPVLGMLTSGALRQTLSPSSFDAQATSLSEIIAQRRILYVCLNSLPDPTVASAVGSLFLADLAACAGERYNNPSIERTTVNLFVDECSNVINRPLIEILNKGAESGLRTTCAMQTVADLAARLGSTDEARMALGNFNNLVCLRTKDRLTQQFVAETFGRTYIANASAALSSVSDSAHPGHFSAASTRQVSSSREEIIPCDILGKLPNCEFFASLAGGRLVKARTPIVVPDPDLLASQNALENS